MTIYDYEPAVAFVVLRPYILRVMFADGLVRDVDLESELHGEVFEPLKDPAYFAQGFLEMGAVEWPNGASFAPEFMYRAGRVIAEAQPA
jgi:uncharacterized protein DUF2442